MSTRRQRISTVEIQRLRLTVRGEQALALAMASVLVMCWLGAAVLVAVGVRS